MKKLKIKTSERKVFYSADTHYSHKNICRGISQWGDADFNTRNFRTLDEMNHAIVDGINSTVGEDDILFHLGDWSFGERENIINFRRKIYCKNVHLIFGNHDEEIMDDTDLHGFFSSVQHYKEINVDGTKFCLFHFKQAIWNKSHKGAYHLYGHSHSGAEHMEIGRSMDVGVDNAFKLLGEYRPFSHEEVIDLLKDRTFKALDHHGKNGIIR